MQEEKQDKKKLSTTMAIIIGMTVSALLGLLASQYLIHKKLADGLDATESSYWKICVLVCIVILIYLITTDVIKYINKPHFSTILREGFLCVVSIALLISPFMLVIVATGAIPMLTALLMLPPQLVAMLGFYFFGVADELAPELLDKNRFKIYLIFALVFPVYAAISGVIAMLPITILSDNSINVKEIYGISLMATLTFTLYILHILLFILRKAMRKAKKARKRRTYQRRLAFGVN